MTVKVGDYVRVTHAYYPMPAGSIVEVRQESEVLARVAWQERELYVSVADVEVLPWFEAVVLKRLQEAKK